MAGKKTREVAMPNDVGEWGEKDLAGAYSGPLTIAGEKVDVDRLPKFGERDDTNADARAPLLPAGSP